MALHYIALHYITLCELICARGELMWAYLHAPACVQVRTRVRESTGAPVFARAYRACTCEMLARSRCAPHGWWGTLYELICFESSQNITTSSGYFGLPLAFGIWWDVTQPRFKDAINEMYNLAISFGLWILWKIVYFEPAIVGYKRHNQRWCVHGCLLKCDINQSYQHGRG
jgi:hypothetical protein